MAFGGIIESSTQRFLKQNLLPAFLHLLPTNTGPPLALSLNLTSPRMMLFPSCFLRKTLLTILLASQKTCPSWLGSPSYLVVEEGAGAKVELVEEAEEESPQ